MAKRNLMNGQAIPMEPGERNRAVTVQQLEDAVPNSKFPTERWTTLVTPVWMRKLDARAGETQKVQQVSAAFDTQWEMGYRDDMDPDRVDVPKKRRLVYQGRTFQIVAASQIGQREGIELLTVAGSKVSA